MTSKPETVPQDVWDKADEAASGFFGTGLTIIIARAIMAAKAEEREACALIAEGGSATFDFQTAWAEMRDAEAGNMSARRNVAAAIRKRGEG